MGDIKRFELFRSILCKNDFIDFWRESTEEPGFTNCDFILPKSMIGNIKRPFTDSEFTKMKLKLEKNKQLTEHFTRVVNNENN